jgi:hypothetical protein
MEIALVRDGQRYFIEVERDDGALIRFRGPGKTHPPHDLVHYATEYELDLDRGFWGKVAHGEIQGRVEVVRQPTRRLPPLRRAPTGKGSEVEAVVGLAERLYRLPARDEASIQRALDSSLTPEIRRRAGLDASSALRICRRLDELAAAWKQVPDGGRLVLAWPPPRGRHSAWPKRRKKGAYVR